MRFEGFSFAFWIGGLIFLSISFFLLLYLLTSQAYDRGQRRQISRYCVSTCLAYIFFIFIFAEVYYLLGILDHDNNLLYMGGKVIAQGKGFWEVFADLFYFSAMTLFTVGYGDIHPLGGLKFVSVVEAFLGYLLPVLVVANGLMKFNISKRK